MTVPAASANSAVLAAKSVTRPMRPPCSSVRAGAYPLVLGDLTSAWHVHDLHQLEYAVEGVIQVETGTERFLSPPQQAVWIPAGVAHRTTLAKVRNVSIFFDPEMIDGMSDRVRVFPADPVLREMAIFARRWPIDRTTCEPLADSYFNVMAGLLERWLETESPFHLPTTADPTVAAAVAYAEGHLDSVTFRTACTAAAVSERTLRRRFAATLHMSWRTYLLRLRLLRAMALLAETSSTVLDVATKVGFDDPSAFARAFSTYTGQTPSAYRKRR
jgi:AraC-like DNA-binding protein